MSNKRTGAKAYSTQIDTEDGKTIADDTIIKLDAHMEEPIPHPVYNGPSLKPDDLKALSAELNEREEQDLAVDIDHERQALENNPDHAPTFTAIELNRLAISMAVAKTKCNYYKNMDTAMALKRIGRVINESAETLLAEGAQWVDIRGLRPAKADDNQEYINPFDVLVDKQVLSFVDTHGARLSREELQREQYSIAVGN